MRLLRKILLAIGIVFIGIQFIQPAHNKSEQVLETDISKIILLPSNIDTLLKNACFDCHSNNTTYPWYANIQPMAWLMANHINNGKAMLNFSEFGKLSKRKQISKLNSISNSIKDKSMPLSSYILMHNKAQLSKVEKELLINWIQQSLDSLNLKN